MSLPVKSLTTLLVETGLIQFGSFIVDGEDRPVLFSLDMLSSYPDVLRRVTEALAPAIGRVDHLVCTPEAVPLGVALSLQTSVPLVYSRGRGEEPVNDLVGAYDTGHPAILITTVYGSDAQIDRLAASARRVGLDVKQIIAVVDVTTGQSDLPVHALIRLGDMVGEMEAADTIPAGQADIVRAWIRSS